MQKIHVKKMPETTRHGRVRTTTAAHGQMVNTIVRCLGFDFANITGRDIYLVNEEGVKTDVLPDLGLFTILDELKDPAPYTNDRFVEMTYGGLHLCVRNGQGDIDEINFDPGTIYVAGSKLEAIERVAYCLLHDDIVLPGGFAYPEGDVTDSTGHAVAYEEFTVIYL